VKSDSNRFILIFSSILFFLLGLATAAIGPLLPQLAENARASLEAIGAVFLGIYLGGLAAQLITGPVGDRLGHHRVIFAALLLMAAGLVGISASRSLPLTIMFAALAGLGHGGVTLSGNVFVAVSAGRKSVSALNLVNLFFGLGAFFGPTFVSFSYVRWQNGLPVLWAAAALSVPLAVVLLQKNFASRQEPTQEAGGGGQVYRSPLLWGLGLLVLVYVGTEIGMGGWTTTYMERTTGMSLERAALVTAGFWLALTAGRLVSAGLGMRISSWNLLLLTLCGALLGGSLLVLSTGMMALTIAAVMLLGFSFGAVYPTVMAIITTHFSQQPGKAAGAAAAMGSIGGALMPWLQGITLERISDQGGAWFTFSGTLIMLTLLFVLLRVRQLRQPANPAFERQAEEEILRG
jgi:MFS transporter, FHS family, glucose/mannose:H+ symporter